MLEHSSKERRRKSAFRVVEKGQLTIRLNSIDGTESQAKQSIRGGVLLELRGNSFSKLYGLAWDTGGANTDGVGVHISR